LLADDRRLREADNLSAKIALVEERRHLADEQRRHEAAAQAAALAEQVLEEEGRRHEAAANVAASAEQALAEEPRRHDASARAATSAELALAKERRRHEMAAQTATMAKAAAQEMSAEADTERWHALLASVTEAIQRVQAACDSLAAPLDALLAEIEALAHDAPPPTTTSPVLPAMSSPHHRPKSYVDAVLTTMGGSSQATSLPLAQAALPSPAVDGKLWTVGQRTRPRRRVGHRHGPRAPNLLEPLLCGRRHRPRAPNECRGWA
jgi:hypothetical protein